jgi:hypothetical protein
VAVGKEWLITLEQQCGMCRSQTWCGRPCKMAPQTEAVAHLAATKAAMAPKKPVQTRKAKKARVDTPKPKGRPTPVHGDPERGFDRSVYQREYMRKRRAVKT